MVRLPTRNAGIMVRAYGDEATRLCVSGVSSTCLLVSGSDPSAVIGWRRDRAYCFDRALYERLREAYEGGAADRLSRLWAEAEALSPAV